MAEKNQEKKGERTPEQANEELVRETFSNFETEEVERRKEMFEEHVRAARVEFATRGREWLDSYLAVPLAFIKEAEAELERRKEKVKK